MNSASQDTAPQPERVNGESAATRGLFDGPYQPPAPIDLIPTRGVLKPRRRARCRGKIEMTRGAQSRDDTSRWRRTRRARRHDHRRRDGLNCILAEVEQRI
jgi:hypothetical protein